MKSPAAPARGLLPPPSRRWDSSASLPPPRPPPPWPTPTAAEAVVMESSADGVAPSPIASRGITPKEVDAVTCHAAPEDFAACPLLARAGEGAKRPLSPFAGCSRGSVPLVEGFFVATPPDNGGGGWGFLDTTRGFRLPASARCGGGPAFPCWPRPAPTTDVVGTVGSAPATGGGACVVAPTKATNSSIQLRIGRTLLSLFYVSGRGRSAIIPSAACDQKKAGRIGESEINRPGSLID